MPQPTAFVISPFTNLSGEIVSRVSGWLAGKRIRRNFSTRTEAEAERQVLELQRVQAATGVRVTATRLSDKQLQEAEVALHRLADRDCSLLEYLDYALANYENPGSKRRWPAH